MKVLSLFDGISSGYISLMRANIKIDRYVSFEINKNSIKVSENNFRNRNIEYFGDINDWEKYNFRENDFDLIIGGSPCQGFSFAGKQLNFNDSRSKLFFIYADIIKKLKPRYFLLENVCMKKEFQDVITKYLGVEPIVINSNLLSAQNRKRIYWANWNIKQPSDKNILLKDIIVENDISFKFESIKKYIIPFSNTLKILDSEVLKRKIGYLNKDSQGNRVYKIHGKSVTLCGNSGGLGSKTGLYLFGCLTPNRINKRQDGQRFNDGKKSYTLTTQDKHGVLIDRYIRKLLPIECERLQTLPDNYTYGFSDNQRYKMIGNGWTIDIITHILQCIN